MNIKISQRMYDLLVTSCSLAKACDEHIPIIFQFLQLKFNSFTNLVLPVLYFYYVFSSSSLIWYAINLSNILSTIQFHMMRNSVHVKYHMYISVV